MNRDVSGDELAGIGAFLSGAGAVVGSVIAYRRLLRRARRECDERVAELRAEFERGVEHGLHLEERGDR